MECRRYIYVYKDEDNKVCYVGLTKNLRKRHNSHQCRSNGKFDNLKQYFVNLGKELPKPYLLDVCLTDEEAQEKEHYWLMEYKNKGWKTINKAKTGKGHSSLGSTSEIRSVEDWYKICKNHASECKNRAEFEDKHVVSYVYSLNHNWLNEFFGPSNRREKNYWTEERVIKAAKECDSRQTFFRKYPRAWEIAKNNGWLGTLFAIKKPKKKTKKKDWEEYRKKVIESYDINLSIRKNSYILGIPKTTLQRIVKQLKIN